MVLHYVISFFFYQEKDQFLKKYTPLVIYLFVFMGEFSFFFMLPILGASASMTVTELSSCLAISVVVESVVGGL